MAEKKIDLVKEFANRKDEEHKFHDLSEKLTQDKRSKVYQEAVKPAKELVYPILVADGLSPVAVPKAENLDEVQTINAMQAYGQLAESNAADTLFDNRKEIMGGLESSVLNEIVENHNIREMASGDPKLAGFLAGYDTIKAYESLASQIKDGLKDIKDEDKEGKRKKLRSNIDKLLHSGNKDVAERVVEFAVQGIEDSISKKYAKKPIAVRNAIMEMHRRLASMGLADEDFYLKGIDGQLKKAKEQFEGYQKANKVDAKAYAERTVGKLIENKDDYRQFQTGSEILYGALQSTASKKNK